MLALKQVGLGFCESLPLIESTSLVSARNWQRKWGDHWVKQWSLWSTVMYYVCCWKLSWAFRSTEVVWWMAVVCDHNIRDSLRNLYVSSFYFFSEECYPFLLSPFGLFDLFFFSFIFALHLFSRIHFLVLYRKKAATLYFLFLTIQAPTCTRVYFHPWFPLSVLHASLCLQRSSYRSLSQLVCKFK